MAVAVAAVLALVRLAYYVGWAVVGYRAWKVTKGRPLARIMAMVLVLMIGLGGCTIVHEVTGEVGSAIVQRFSQRFLPYFAAGKLEPCIDRSYPMSEVRAAHERMEKNENLGKIVLLMPSARDSHSARA